MYRFQKDTNPPVLLRGAWDHHCLIHLHFALKTKIPHLCQETETQPQSTVCQSTMLLGHKTITLNLIPLLIVWQTALVKIILLWTALKNTERRKSTVKHQKTTRYLQTDTSASIKNASTLKTPGLRAVAFLTWWRNRGTRKRKKRRRRRRKKMRKRVTIMFWPSSLKNQGYTASWSMTPSWRHRTRTMCLWKLKPIGLRRMRWELWRSPGKTAGFLSREVLQQQPHLQSSTSIFILFNWMEIKNNVSCYIIQF